MKYVVVYDSVFGNTKQVAKIIKETIGEACDIFHVKEQINVQQYDQLIIGSPTRAFRPTPDVLKFVRSLTKNAVKKIVAFDTRMDIENVNSKVLTRMAKWFGFSNDSIEKIAKKKKIECIQPSGEFFVTDTEGPLREGEVERIKEWTQQII